MERYESVEEMEQADALAAEVAANDLDILNVLFPSDGDDDNDGEAVAERRQDYEEIAVDEQLIADEEMSDSDEEEDNDVSSNDSKYIVSAELEEITEWNRDKQLRMLFEGESFTPTVYDMRMNARLFNKSKLLCDTYTAENSTHRFECEWGRNHISECLFQVPDPRREHSVWIFGRGRVYTLAGDVYSMGAIANQNAMARHNHLCLTSADYRRRMAITQSELELWMSWDAESIYDTALTRMDLRFMWTVFFGNNTTRQYLREGLFDDYTHLLDVMAVRYYGCYNIRCNYNDIRFSITHETDDPRSWFDSFDMEWLNRRFEPHRLESLASMAVIAQLKKFNSAGETVLVKLWTFFNNPLFRRVMNLHFRAGPPTHRRIYNVRMVFLRYLHKRFFITTSQFGYPHENYYKYSGINPVPYCNECEDNMCRTRDELSPITRDGRLPTNHCLLCKFAGKARMYTNLLETNGHLYGVRHTGQPIATTIAIAAPFQ